LGECGVGGFGGLHIWGTLSIEGRRGGRIEGSYLKLKVEVLALGIFGRFVLIFLHLQRWGWASGRELLCMARECMIP